MYPWEFIDGYTRILTTINRPHVNVEQVADDVLGFMIDLAGADKGEIVLFRDNVDGLTTITEEAAVRFRRHRGYQAEHYRELRDSGLLLESVRSVLKNRQSVVVQDTDDEPPEARRISRLLRNGSWMNHVLEVEGRIVAFIHLAHRDKRRFDVDDLSDLKGVSLLLATALNISRLWEQERKHMRDLIKTLNRVVEVKDQYTAGHVERVKLYSGVIAGLLALPEEQCRVIEMAAYLHDIGKIGISDAILKKPGPLTDEERRVMMQHVPIGDRILDIAPILDEARHMASLHHEYVDGSGYGGMEELPIGARVISAADAWDALTTTRPYRAAMPVEEAIEIMTDLDLKQWDSGVVNVFVEHLRSATFLAFAVRHKLIAMRSSAGDKSSFVNDYDADESILKFRDFGRFYENVTPQEADTLLAAAAQGRGAEQRFHLRRD